MAIHATWGEATSVNRKLAGSFGGSIVFWPCRDLNRLLASRDQ